MWLMCSRALQISLRTSRIPITSGNIFTNCAPETHPYIACMRQEKQGREAEKARNRWTKTARKVTEGFVLFHLLGGRIVPFHFSNHSLLDVGTLIVLNPHAMNNDQ